MRFVLRAAVCALIVPYLVLLLIFFAARSCGASRLAILLNRAMEGLARPIDWCLLRARQRQAPRPLSSVEDMARRVAGILIVAALLSFPALAFAATNVAIVDVTPLINALLGLGGAVLMAAIPLIVARLKTAGVIKDQAMATALQTAVQAAAQYGLNAVQQQMAGKTVTVDLQNKVVAAGAQYLVQHVPDAIQHFGKSDEGIAQMLLARLNLSGGTITLTGQSAPAVPAAA